MKNWFVPRARAAIAGALLISACLAAPDLYAQSQLLDKDAPDFTVGETINESAIQTIEDARCEVILIKYWGIN